MCRLHSWGFSLAAGGCMGLSAAEPVFTHIHPAGVQAGTTSMVSFNGKFDPWPCQVYASLPGLTFVPQKEAGTYEVTVDAAVPVGPCLLRAFNAEGASAPVALVIAHSPQTLEAGPNDDFRTPQVLTTSIATVNGRLDKPDDVDSYQVVLSKGQTLVVWVEAHVLAAGFDAMLRVTDFRGVTLAFNHDGPATMDPLLVFTAPADGTYVVQIMGHQYPAASDIRFAGGNDCVYRLHLTTGPVVRNCWPLAAAKEGLVAAEGWNLPTDRIASGSGIQVLFPPPAGCPVELAGPAETILPAPPCAMSARIATAGEEDRYRFAALKGETFELTVSGPTLGSEIDPWVKVLDADGKELAGNDDAAGSAEARLAWTAPEAGTFVAVVGDVTQRGGPDFYYRFALTRPFPAVSATTAGHAFQVPAGGTTAVKIKVDFTHGFAEPLTLSALSLPDGVTAAGVEVPVKGGEVSLTLTAEPGAPAASRPVQFMLTSAVDKLQRPVVHRMVSSSENNGVPQGFRQLLIPETAKLWLTVTAPAPEPKKAASPAP